MTEQEFHQFRDLIYQRTHIFCTQSQKPLFERKIHGRLTTSGAASWQEYYRLLTSSRTGDEEFIKLIEIIAVHETSFFRIQGHFTGLMTRVFPSLSRFSQAHFRPIQIWDAGCSTGEEPYSIIITFLETLAQQGQQTRESRDLQLLASDLSYSVIQQARKGIYPRYKVHKLPTHILETYFTPQDQGYRLIDRVKQFVTFSWDNLADLKAEVRPTFDIIFCRNVLIYFDRRAQAKLLEKLIALLYPGGYLFLGDAESIHPFPDSCHKLAFIESGDAIFYQKRGV